MGKHKAIALLSLAIALSACGQQKNNLIEGYVATADEKAATGAIVTLTEPKTNIQHSVFADAKGNYSFSFANTQGWTLSVAYPGSKSIHYKIDAANKPQNFKLTADPLAWEKTTSDNWVALLPDGQMRREFIINCLTCHEIAGNRAMVDGKARDLSQWSNAIAMMRALDIYKVVPPDFKDAQYAQWLATHLSPEKLKNIALPKVIDPALAGRVEITEYPYPEAQDVPHDLVIGPDGRIWVTGMFAGDVLVLDPKTGKTRAYPVNGGKSGGDVRALKLTKEGILWVVLGETKSLVKLDIHTGKYQTFPVDMYAHDVEIDSQGVPWVNDYMGKPERIARVDPLTGKVTNYTIQAPQLPASEGDPLPYGLQVDQQDIVWGSQLAANTLFRFDPKTQTSQIFNMPEYNSGPRRLALGKDGTIWIPEWNTGFLTGFDPRTKTFTRTQLGQSTIGLYDVEVDPRSGVVWATGSLSAQVIRFDPSTKKIDTIPLPTQPAFMRHIAVDPNNGDVWTTYSELPAAYPKIVRIRVKDASAPGTNLAKRN